MVLNERFETTKLIIHVKIILYIVKNNCELHLAQLVKSNKVLLKKKKKVLGFDLVYTKKEIHWCFGLIVRSNYLN